MRKEGCFLTSEAQKCHILGNISNETNTKRRSTTSAPVSKKKKKKNVTKLTKRVGKQENKNKDGNRTQI